MRNGPAQQIPRKLGRSKVFSEQTAVDWPGRARNTLDLGLALAWQPAGMGILLGAMAAGTSPEFSARALARTHRGFTAPTAIGSCPLLEPGHGPVVTSLRPTRVRQCLPSFPLEHVFMEPVPDANDVVSLQCPLLELANGI